MKVEVWAIGKCGHSYLEEGISVYKNKLKHYLSFEYIEWNEPKSIKSSDKNQALKLQADWILQKLNGDDRLILLDEQGQTFTSRSFSKYVNKWMVSGSRKIIFLIGGAFGFHQDVYQRAENKISLSAMTYSHDMVRLIFLEQLYRACSILRNEPYHND